MTFEGTKTALDIALANKHQECVDVLRKHDASKTHLFRIAQQARALDILRNSLRSSNEDRVKQQSASSPAVQVNAAHITLSAEIGRAEASEASIFGRGFTSHDDSNKSTPQ